MNTDRVILKMKSTNLLNYFLKNKAIGISISESEDINELGFSSLHLKDLIIEVSRYILASGGKLAYGGDMRQGGFTELIFDLLAYYTADKSLQPHERFINYLAFPISTTISIEKQAELSHNVIFKKILPPADLKVTDTEKFLKPDSLENQYIWARSLTAMRQEMERDCHARIFIGGKREGFKGQCPGILEEFLLAITKKQPIYLVGTFGGITRDIIEALEGNKMGCFRDQFYSDNKEYRDFILYFNERQENTEIDFQKYLNAIQNYGLKRIYENNGLSHDENLRLTSTSHVGEIIYLILKGLRKCCTQ